MSRCDVDDPDEPAEKRVARATKGLGSPYISERLEAANQVARLATAGIISREAAGALIAPHLAEPVLQHGLAFAIAFGRAFPAGSAPRVHALLDRALAEGAFREIAYSFRRAFAMLLSVDRALAESLRTRAEAEIRDRPMTPLAAKGAILLGEIAAAGDGSAVRPLLALLNSKDEACSLAATFALARSGRPEGFEALRDILDKPPGEKIETIFPALEESASLTMIDGLIKARETPGRGWSEQERPHATRKRDFVLYRLRNIRETVRERLERARVDLPDLSRP